jgi:hypothetical protein
MSGLEGFHASYDSKGVQLDLGPLKFCFVVGRSQSAGRTWSAVASATDLSNFDD